MRYFDVDWDQAACNNKDPQMFDPPKGYSYQTQVQNAKKICRGCPIRESCLLYALSLSPEDDSPQIWGGATHGERKTLRRFVRNSSQPKTPAEILARLKIFENF